MQRQKKITYTIGQSVKSIQLRHGINNSDTMKSTRQTQNERSQRVPPWNGKSAKRPTGVFTPVYWRQTSHLSRKFHYVTTFPNSTALVSNVCILHGHTRRMPECSKGCPSMDGDCRGVRKSNKKSHSLHMYIHM